MTIELTNEERKTRQLFASIKDPDDVEIAIKAVFVAMYYASMPADRINAIAWAMHPSLQGIDLSRGLTNLCRAKILRSHVVNKLRMYEVNY